MLKINIINKKKIILNYLKGKNIVQDSIKSATETNILNKKISESVYLNI